MKLITVFSVLIFILSETRFGNGQQGSKAITDEQRKEIEKLRTDIEKALEEDEEKTLKAQGIIIQPEWTKNADVPHKMKSKVIVTKTGLDEVKKLRDEINAAIEQDQYKAIGSNSEVGGNTKVIQEIHKKYSKNENNKHSGLLGVLSSTLPTDGPNLVESSSNFEEPEIDIRKLQRLELSKRRTRETLILESIEEDLNFDFGMKVQEWKHIIHGGQEFFIGRLDEDLQIVHKNALEYEASKIVHIGAPITYLETYTFWNAEERQQEGIIIVASGDQVLWYRANEEHAQIMLYWEWVVGSAISGLTYFEEDDRDYLVVSSNQSLRAGYYALNIYQFDLKNKEFWITQRLQLAHPCNEVTFLNTGRDYVLAVPQNDTAVIYMFNPHIDNSNHVHFEFKYKYISEDIQDISAFQMGGRSYLALGGMQPKILLYQQGEFVPKTIFDNNFGTVEYFFPVPIRTYRDDLILLVQHRVDFSTHNLTVLEALIWNGEAFEASIPAPCKLGTQMMYGVNCMLDIQRDAGLKGAAVLRHGNDVSIIVPRHNAESGLFRLNTKLLAKNSELKDVQEIFDFLKEWVAEQDALIEKAQSFLAEPMDANPPNFENLQLLKTPQLFFAGAFEELYVNDYKWTNEDSKMDLNHVLDEIERLEHELRLTRSKRDADKITGRNASFESLDFDEVEAEFLEVDNMNDEPFYIQNGRLDFNGLLNVAELEVLEFEHISEEVEIQLNELALENDIEFEIINDIPWQDIAENLVFLNRPVELDELEIKGNLIVEDPIEINRLNSLKFPEDYLWTEGVPNQIINAEKTFVGTLSANHVDTEGQINGKDPLDAITLSDAQDWNGTPTFANLEISEIFELNGTTRGRAVANFPQNPSLEETNFITANCEFSNLRVMGTLIVEGNYNGEPLDPLISDIIQRPQDPKEEIQIPSQKTFSNINFPIDFHIQNNKINNIPIDQFVPSESVQELDLTTIHGDVYFGNLTITGSYDGVLIDELIKNTIRIDIPQNLTNTQLNFVGPLQADAVNIVKTLNDASIATDFQTIHENLVMPKSSFRTLKAYECNISGDINGTSKFNGIDLVAFLAERNSTNVDRSRNIFIDELILEKGLNVDEIHGLKIEALFEYFDSIDLLPEMVLEGKVHIDHISVSGDVQVNKLNGQDFDGDVQLTAVWLNRPNYLSTKFQFVDMVELKGPLNVLGDYNNENLPELIDDMVFRNVNGTILILAPKVFSGYVEVLGNTQVDALNGIPFNVFANKASSAVFEGSLQINGNLIVQELILNGSFNGFPVSELCSQLRYDQNFQAFVLKGITNLNTSLKLHDLTVYGDLNEFKNLEKFFANLVYKRGRSVLNGNYNFTGRVSIERGAYIAYLNGHNLMDILSDIAYINGLEPLILESPIHFMSPIKASFMDIKGVLNSSNLNGCSIENWLDDTLNIGNSEIITKPMHFGPGSLHGNRIFATFLNDIDLSKVITLNTPQNLTGKLKFSEVYLDGTIKVEGPINDVDLHAEFENTMLTSGNQHIETPLIIHNAHVLQNLSTTEVINGDKNLKNVATLYEDAEFESPLFFEELRTKNIFTEDLISGIDFNEWYKLLLREERRSKYRPNGNWSIGSLNLENGPAKEKYQQGTARAMSGEDASDRLCYKLREILTKYNRRPYALKNLKKSFELNFPKSEGGFDIRRSFNFKNYLLINSGCSSTIFKWNAYEKKYEMKINFESGLIDHLVVADDIKSKPEITKFMTNSYQPNTENCTLLGLNLWELKNDEVIHLKNFKEDISDIWTEDFEGYLIGITDAGLKKISTAVPYDIQPLHMDTSFETEDYSFLGRNSSSKIFYSNGTHYAQISQASNFNKGHFRNVPNSFNMFTKYPHSVHPLTVRDESILNPNASLLQKLTFSELSQNIERILEDLDFRLDNEVNTTQLSITDMDFNDERLIQDVSRIIEQLHSQTIYPPNTFNDDVLDSLQIPENPTHLLAARAIQIIWPVIVEIDEMCRYLRGNSATTHPACGCVLNYLGFAIKEVIELAAAPVKNLNYSATLSSVINRIRQFDVDLKELETELKLEIAEDLKAEIENEIHNLTKYYNELINKENKSFNSLIETQKFKKNNKLNRNELLSLEVGAEFSGFNILAVTRSERHQTPENQSEGIYLYTNLLKNDLFQFISAYMPRSMTTLRMRDITLLSYVEHCCTVNVLQYRGVEGFVNFATFSLKVPIKQIISLNLPHADYGQRHYLAVVHHDKLIFYEVVFSGLRRVPTADHLKCN